MRLVTALGLFLVATCLAQDTKDAPRSTGALFNCRWWHSNNDIGNKVGWVQGYHDGLMIGTALGSNADDGGIYKRQFPQNLTYIEIAQSVDQFCSNPVYAPLELMVATGAVAMKAKGTSQSKIDEYVSSVLAQMAKSK